jgi:hypothetical protein
MLHRLELGQRAAELDPLAGVRHRKVPRGVQRADGLHATGPRAAPGEFVGDLDVEQARRVRVYRERERATRLAREVVGHRCLRIGDQPDV